MQGSNGICHFPFFLYDKPVKVHGIYDQKGEENETVRSLCSRHQTGAGRTSFWQEVKEKFRTMRQGMEW